MGNIFTNNTHLSSTTQTLVHSHDAVNSSMKIKRKRTFGEETETSNKRLKSILDLRNKRSFTTTDVISGLKRQCFYHVPLEEFDSFQTVYQKVLNRQYVLLYGPYRSSKTSHLMKIAEEIREERDDFTCVIASFDFVASIEDLFEAITVSLRMSDILPNNESINSFEELVECMPKTSGSQYKIVWLIDEFDALQNLPKEVQKQFLASLRSMQLNQQLYAFLGVGTYRLTALAKDSPTKDYIKPSDERPKEELSPFTLSNLVSVSYLTLTQCQALFLGFWKDLMVESPGLNFSETDLLDIVSDIYSSTNGYPGYVCYLGIFLENRVSQQVDGYSFKQWCREVLFIREIPQSVFQADMFFYRIELIELENLVQKLLNTDSNSYKLFEFKNLDLLACIAVLRYIPERQIYEFSCPLVREICMRKYLPTKTINVEVQDCIQFHPFSYSSFGEKLILSSLKYLDPTVIFNSATSNVHGPSERIYQAQLFTVFEQLIIKERDLYLFFEARQKLEDCNYQKRVDFLVKNGGKVGIEPKVNKTLSTEISEALNQVENYMALIELDFCYVINFIHETVASSLPNFEQEITRMLDEVQSQVQIIIITTKKLENGQVLFTVYKKGWKTPKQEVTRGTLPRN